MMQVSVEKVSNVERRLIIVVPAEIVEEAYNKELNEFAKNANIKGFRPGKAPLSYIAQVYGEEARKKTLSEVMQKAFNQAIIEQNLKPVNVPRVEPKMMVLNQPFEFAASFEVLPEIDKIQVSIDSIEKLNVAISPEDVSRVLEQLKKQYTKWNLADRAAKDNDRIVLDYYTVFENKEDTDNKIENYSLVLGNNVMLPGFEEGLQGVKSGEERTLHLSYPADFTIKERAGKAVDFVVKVKEIFEADEPIFDDAFIRKLGIESGKEEDLREHINQLLSQERDRLVKEKLKEQVFSKLLEQNSLEIPNSLITHEAQSIHDEIYSQQKHHRHDHQSHSDEELQVFRDIARKRVALSLLLTEFAKQNQLKADKDKVRQRIQEIASHYENPKEVAEWLSSNEQRVNVEAQVMEDQVMEKLLEGLPVTEKSISYDELKNLALSTSFK